MSDILNIEGRRKAREARIQLLTQQSHPNWP
jgi:hypothetical protein